jgi:hypothetical protein
MRCLIPLIWCATRWRTQSGAIEQNSRANRSDHRALLLPNPTRECSLPDRPRGYRFLMDWENSSKADAKSIGSKSGMDWASLKSLSRWACAAAEDCL